MSNIFICYKGCSTCAKAEKKLKELKIDYIKREITEETPTVEELKKWINLSSKDEKLFFNTRGQAYRDLNLKEKYDSLSFDERLQLLSEDGMLIKRPILVSENNVFLGYKEEQYQSLV